MKCPKCGSLMMEFQDGSKVVMDFCSKGCSGIWFDQSELIQYTSHTEHLLPFDQLKNGSTGTAMTCPRCPGEKLWEVKPFDNSELLIDFCQNCNGVFLDARELGTFKKIAAKVDCLKGRFQKAKSEMESAGYLILGD